MIFIIKRNCYDFSVYENGKSDKIIFSFIYTSAFWKQPYGTIKDENGNEIAKIYPNNESYIQVAWKTDYEIVFSSDTKTYKLINTNSWKGKWELDLIKNYHFSFQKNRENQASIFKNETQIAGISKNSVEFFDTSTYELVIKENEDIQIVLCLFFAVNFGKSNRGATINFNIGNPFYEKFNENWDLNFE